MNISFFKNTFKNQYLFLLYNFFNRLPDSAAANRYDSVSRLMRLWQAKYHPKTKIKGTTLIEVYEFIKKNPGCLDVRLELDGRLIESEITVELLTANDRNHLIMYDRQFTEECTDTRRIFVDGTFAIVPKIRKIDQFLTIMVEKFGRVSFFKLFKILFIFFILSLFLS